MTTANKITIVRILLVPFFISQVLYYLDGGEHVHRLLAILSFGLAALSDGLDGYIARRYHQHSELGAVLDPLADKLLLASGIILLSLHNEPNLTVLPKWLAVTVVGRDAILLVGLVVIHYVAGKARVRPHLVGKVATVLQMVAVLWVLLLWDDGWLKVWTLGAAATTAISGILYLLDGIRQLSAHPASLPSPPPKTPPSQISDQ